MIKLFSLSFWNHKFNSLTKLIAWKLYPLKESIRKNKITRQIKQYKTKGILPVDIGSDAGIGAKLLWYLQILLFCKENNLKPYIKFTYDDDRKEDFFENYLISKFPKNSEMKYIRINTLWDLNFGKDYDKEHLNVETAAKLANEYITVRPEFMEEAKRFVDTKFCNENVLGVHFRSTDKITEAGFVSYETVLLNIDYCFKKYNHFKKIFIATDDNKFIKFIEKSHLSPLVCYHDDSFRSDDAKAIHTRININRYNINKDAIINMIILSHCSFIIKTASNLSAISLFLNPSIPYMMLNKPFNMYFPDNEFVKNTTLEPITK